MKRVMFSCALLLVLSLMNAAARAESFSGTWSIAPSNKAGQVDLRLQYRRADAIGNEEWDESSDVPLTELHGLTDADLHSSGARKTFTLAEDAGEFRADGTFSGGEGAGTWIFAPSSSFGNALRRRGVDGPTEKQQFQLAMGRFKLATLDTLLRSGFERPSMTDLVAMSGHGISDEYVSAMRDLRFSTKTVSELIRLRDHGVDSRYATDMLRRAPQLNADDLIELRDHGVSSEYMQALVQGGYANISPAQAERMRDHGVNHTYIEGLQRLGYHPSADDLIRLIDHGVSVSFIERMRNHGYTHLSVDELIRLRDHGF